MYVVGTAGHVDHGKSTLVRRLTGMDPDRLQEEKDRGLTIDLGFAWLTLPSGRDVSIVDVPGHKRFVKNMLAGAVGFDLALLVIAADEGPRQQTREHLAILEVLGVTSLLVVLTKIDAADPELRQIVEMDVQELLQGTAFAGAPAISVSAATGEGIDGLLHAIDERLTETRERIDRGRPRLAVDRVFPVHGFGTVVTGTLIDGALAVGDAVEFCPSGRSGRIRGLQRHGRQVERLRPGTRAAVNVGGIHAHDIQRGAVLAHPGDMKAVTGVGVRLRAVSTLSTPIRRVSGVSFLSGTAESEARLRLLDRDDLFPGDEAWATVYLDEPMALRDADRFVVRNANETIGGGVVVTSGARLLRRRRAFLVPRLEELSTLSPPERVLDRLIEGPLPAHNIAAATGVSPSEADDAVRGLLDSEAIVDDQGVLYASTWLRSQVSELEALVRAGLRDRPLRVSLPLEEVRRRGGLAPGPFRTVLATALSSRVLEMRSDTGVTLHGYEVELSPAQQQEVDRFLGGLGESLYASADTLSDAELARYLIDHGDVEDVGGSLLAAPAFREMTAKVIEFLEAGESITLAEGRDLLGTNRKFAQAFLERLDALGVTRRTGDVRRLRLSQARAPQREATDA